MSFNPLTASGGQILGHMTQFPCPIVTVPEVGTWFKVAKG